MYAAKTNVQSKKATTFEHPRAIGQVKAIMASQVTSHLVDHGDQDMASPKMLFFDLNLGIRLAIYEYETLEATKIVPQQTTKGSNKFV